MEPNNPKRSFLPVITIAVFAFFIGIVSLTISTLNQRSSLSPRAQLLLTDSEYCKTYPTLPGCQTSVSPTPTSQPTTGSTGSSALGTSPTSAACTTDVKQCPDGSYVSRISSTCEFATCPSTGGTGSGGTGGLGGISPTLTTGCIKSGGDANCDGRVDLVDFEKWRREFTGEETTLLADLNRDGKIDLVDFEIWRQGFFSGGNTGGGISPTKPVATCVPRPACLDAFPRCDIPETSDMCPSTAKTPTPTVSSGGIFNP